MKTTLFTTLVIGYLVINSVVFGNPSLRGYYIGNSLTYDCRPDLMPETFESEGYEFEYGWHIACGDSLEDIVNDPEGSYCLNPDNIREPFGLWDNALKSYDWDYITLQAYRGATGSNEVSATTALISEALSLEKNTNCVFYLYFAWPPSDDAPSFSEGINQPYPSGGDNLILSKEFADFWYSGVTQSFQNIDIRLIPTGHVLEALDQKMQEISVGSSSLSEAYDLYRDIHHLEDDYPGGRYVAHATMLAAILNKHPNQINFNTSIIDDTDPELAQLSNEVIWSVLTQDNRTKVSDQPSISIRTNKVGGLEVSFVESLMLSTNLSSSTWVVTNLVSPHRLFTTSGPKTEFFRAIQADGL